MSEIKLISPLLDGFTVGNPISDHDGVRCCPAIKENTDKKYIVKIISIPATQVQMDALLLAGAYKDPADAMEYFRQISEGIMKEAELLKKLSKLEGFLPYEGWQMEPITRHRLGYEIYLIGSYKRTLEKHVKRHPVTHLEAINLGLDLCSALSVCRLSGALYVDLKPSNIFVSEKKGYRIGDLGFVEMDALNYTALPGKYQSPYTPPELFDPMASLNLTVDTYAVGMILYQLYNDGQLPFKGTQAPQESFPAPVNADYELAEIILKAIHPDPAERWQDPKELGKALASYMQRNSVNDVPITPHTPLDVKPEDIVAVPKKKKSSKKSKPAKAVGDSPSSEADQAESLSEESNAEAAAESIGTNSTVTEEISQETTSEETVIDESPVISDAEALSAEVTTAAEESLEIPTEESNMELESEEDAVAEIQDVEETPTEDIETQDPNALLPEEMSDELSQIMAKADDLISHEIPEDIVTEIPQEEDPFAFITEDSDEIDDSDIPEDPIMEDEEEEIPQKKKKKEKKKKNKETKYADPKYKRRRKRFFSTILFLLVLSILGTGAFWYYQNMYLQTIDSITIDGDREQITVTVDTNIDESKLFVTCTDNYGKSETRNLSNGEAQFTNIKPNTMYNIQLHMEGFHQLVGQTSDVYISDATTRIVSFTSVAGSEDGSVKLNFTVDGEEPNDWAVFYSTEGEEEKRKTFTGHSVNISDLTVGSVYTFRLETGESISLDGQTTLEVMASRLILAENLSITSSNGTDIMVHWTTPGDIVVDSWNVRCYNDLGYEEQVTVSDTEVMFTGIDPISSYTVEVTAAGMTQPARTSITANPISITNLTVDDASHKKLTVKWEFTGNEPKDGWLVMYSLVGGQKNVVKATKSTADITPKIPGAKYDITVQTADGTTIFNNVTSYTCPEAEVFNKHSLSADQLAVDLVKTPEEDPWYFDNIGTDAITDTFSKGDSISIVMRSADNFYMTGAEVDIMYVFRDAYGNVLPELLTEQSVYWKQIWNGGDVKNGELNLPVVPSAAGEYVLDLYFDGMLVANLPLTITE